LLIAKAKQKVFDGIADTVLTTLPFWLNQSFSSKHVTFHLASQTFPQLKTKQNKKTHKRKHQITAAEIPSL